MRAFKRGIYILGFYEVSTSLYSFIYPYYIQTYAEPPPPLSEKYGFKSWAIITGASEGIGRALAKQCTAEGLSVHLSARNQDNLNSAMQECYANNARIDVELAPFDFSKAGLDDYRSVFNKRMSEGEGASLLINNVGISTGATFDKPKTFFDLSPSETHRKLIVNIVPQVILTKYFLEHARKRK